MKFLKKLGVKLQLLLITILGVVGAIFYITTANKIKLKQKFKYELEKVKREAELVRLGDASKVNKDKLLELDEKEAEIRKKIQIIEEQESKGKELSIEELEEFFNSRGF